MPRKPRVSIQGAYYHVIIRGNNRAQIFFTDDDRKVFLFFMKECVKKYKCIIHAYCLMTNHVHIALQLDEIPVSKIMHNITFRYARWINTKQKRVGHVFQGRFKSIFIGSKTYLLELVRYIHLNPVRAKIVMSVEEYTWSSHFIYLSNVRHRWVTTSVVLGLLESDDRAARVKYKELMNCPTSQDIEKILLNDGLTITDNHFEYPALGVAVQPKILEFSDLVNCVCQYFSFTEAELTGLSRDRRYSLARAAIVWLSKEFNIENQTFCAKFLNRDIANVSRMLTRILSDELNIGHLKQIKSMVKKTKFRPDPISLN